MMGSRGAKGSYNTKTRRKLIIKITSELDSREEDTWLFFFAKIRIPVTVTKKNSNSTVKTPSLDWVRNWDFSFPKNYL